MLKLVLNNSNILYQIKEGFLNPLFLLLLFTYSSFAQDNQELYESIFNFNNHNFEQQIEKTSSENKTFYTNKLTFLNILFNQQSASDQSIEYFENTIETIENTRFNNPQFKSYYIGEAQLMLSLIQMKKGHHFRSAHNFIRAYDSFEKNLKNYPEFKDPLVAIKFMEISASVLPKSVQWFSSWFGLKSDKIKATEQLIILYNSSQLSPLAKIQCYALSLYLKLHFNSDILLTKPNSNLALFHILEAQHASKKKDYHKMIELLEKLPNHLNIKHFLLGKAYFITNHINAKKELERFTKTTSTQVNTSAAYFYLYQLNILNREDSLYNLNQTLNDNPEKNYRDSWAKREILEPQSVFLIKTRNLFDAGAYKKCIEALKSRENPSTRELYYLTNCYIQLKQIDNAKLYYSKLIKQPFLNKYYIPKTGYNLAKITYTTEPQYAKTILTGISKYNNYPFQKEIEAKSELILKQCH